MSYHNTNGLTGIELRKAVENATKQEEAILIIYINTRRKLTPWDIHGMLTRAGKKLPVTSTRRGITNLMNKGELVKTSETKPGEYNSPEHYYHINPKKHPTPSTAKQVGLWG